MVLGGVCVERPCTLLLAPLRKGGISMYLLTIISKVAVKCLLETRSISHDGWLASLCLGAVTLNSSCLGGGNSRGGGSPIAFMPCLCGLPGASEGSLSDAGLWNRPASYLIQHKSYDGVFSRES